MLMAQLQDGRDDEAQAAAIAERRPIAGEPHDVRAHSLPGLPIQLQGARKLAGHEQGSPGLRAAIGPASRTRQGRAGRRPASGERPTR